MLRAIVGGKPLLLPIIFPNHLVHEDVAIHMKMNLLRNHSWPSTVNSAGFINSLGVCSGKSESLKCDSSPEDTNIIKTYDYTQGLC
jgi:hypothetical protein